MDIRFPLVMLGNFSVCFIHKEKPPPPPVSKARLGDSPSLEDKIIKGMTKGILHCPLICILGETTSMRKCQQDK